MKIKVKEKDYEAVLAMPRKSHKKPMKQSMLFRLLLRVLSAFELRKVRFTCKKIGMERLGKREPCLVLMNHSSFIDLKIASTLLFHRPFNIVCTSDGFVGKNWLMRRLGCIPTTKFVSDVGLVRDMAYAFKTLKSSVLMYPEASYSFDGTATPLPDSIGQCLKMFGVPVVMIRTYGAFARDPLYNCLQQRKVDVSAEMEYLLSPEDIAEKSAEELTAILAAQFDFDYFRWQKENSIRITEPFRADGLNRVLYKCPHCFAEGKTEGKGTHITCHACGKSYELTEYGELRATEGETEFSHIPDWYAWERRCVREELENGTYRLDVSVDISVLVDTQCIYRVGDGRLLHTGEGFHLTGCEGKLDYTQKPKSSYSLYSDFFWYEIADVICIGNSKMQYYCFPRMKGDIVAKARLAAEELYKLSRRVPATV
ncbi:MAG: 1-acyl-sn-glycerol-3-phosphate acyltransferase [Clostridia bacterium]|nr:1-acyl-sn-glycerol-3-phosphate acyltransferase [Clostridia bacterium]